MINRLLISISFICLFAFHALSQHQLVTEYNADSTIRSEGLTDDNNLKQGNWTYYNNDGKVIQMGRFLDGKRTGMWLAYDTDGNIIMETNFG